MLCRNVIINIFGPLFFLINFHKFYSVLAQCNISKLKKYAMENFDNFIKGMPKAELHVHVEGTLEPELKFRFCSGFPGFPFARE